MPRPSLPPTPGSSTEIKGQDTAKNLSHLQMAFELPPSAIMGGSKAPVSPKATYPVQPSEAVKARRRSSAAAQQQQQKDSFALPPPPTRSRKIIQMKPQAQAESTGSASTAAKASRATASTGTALPKSASESGSKKKQASATSAAGRKIARKTAHSLIERRRRSKMNEEFAVLKGLIPACTGDMHKLAILQASIEYVRYLEDCITSLKSQCDAQTSLPSLADFRPSAPYDGDQFDEDEEGDVAAGADAQEDVEMTGSSSTPVVTTHNQSPPIPLEPERGVQSHQPSVSPALLAQDVHPRQQSYSSVSTADRRHYSVSSSVTSPIFRGQAQDYAASIGSISHSALTSPALMPQQEDHEATAALLMLNADRRGTFSQNSNSTARGMSVRDLLSS